MIRGEVNSDGERVFIRLVAAARRRARARLEDRRQGGSSLSSGNQAWRRAERLWPDFARITGEE